MHIVVTIHYQVIQGEFDYMNYF